MRSIIFEVNFTGRNAFVAGLALSVSTRCILSLKHTLPYSVPLAMVFWMEVGLLFHLKW